MAVKIICPQCGENLTVSDAFPGSKLDCSKCSAVIILAVEVDHPSRRPLVKPGPKPVAPDDANIVKKRAISHLEKWLDISATQISNTLEILAQNSAYTIWKIPKGESGFFREIAAPCESLKVIQRRILDRLLYRVPVSNAAHGFIPGRSIVTNASYHLQTAQALFNLDLKDAFPSVDSTRVKHLLVRYLKIPLQHLGETVAHPVLDQVIEFLVALTTYNERLPQGGPCSGCLLNIACITLDKNIYRLLARYGDSYRYSRYADDITISAPFAIPQPLQQELQKIVHDCGFQINPRKCVHAVRSNGQRLEVTGLILEKKQVRIPSAKLEVFRAIIHQATVVNTEQLTPEKRLEIQSIVAFVKMVYQKIPYRIWAPYKTYMEKHGIRYQRQAVKSYLDLYPR